MTADPPLPPLDDQLCFALYGASLAMSRVYKPLLDELGITYPQFLTLNVLWEGDGCTIGAIAERLALESSTITPLVKRLSTAGLVVRERGRDDERQVRVRLTERGRALQADGVCVADAVFQRTGLTKEEMAALTRQVHALRHALTEPPAAK